MSGEEEESVEIELSTEQGQVKEFAELTNVIIGSANMTNVTFIPNLVIEKSADELLVLLRQWNLEHLYETLYAQSVTIEVLKIIKIHHIERLLRNQNVATQIYFEHNLEKWRESIGSPLHMTSHSSLFRTSRATTPLESSPLSSPGSWSPTNTNQNFKFSSLEPEQFVSLAVILNETNKGRLLTDYYRKTNGFQEEQRLLLIGTIAQYIVDNNINVSLSSTYKIEEQILERFPTEILEFYRTSNRGRLYNKIRNLKGVTKSLKLESTENESQNKDTTLVPEEDAEIMIKAIKHDKLSLQEFDHYWKACSRHRISEIRKASSTFAIFNDWPQYKLPNGYRLIDLDFDVIFPQNPTIVDHWDSVTDALLTVLKNQGLIKDKTILDKLVDMENISKNGKEAVLLWATHGCLIPFQRIVNKAATGKKTYARYTIVDSQNSFILLCASIESLEDHLRQKISTGNSIQPFLMLVGENLRSIDQIFVYFDGIKFGFNSVIRAVDVCFKITHLFQLEYPTASTNFWTFIEQYFYKISTKATCSRVNVLCCALDKAVKNQLSSN